MESTSIFLPMLSLLPFAVVGSFTPGPNNILVMSYGISHGLRATLPYQTGAGLSCFCIIAGTVLAGAQLEKILPTLMVAVKYIGCAYMLWLAWVVARSPAPQQNGPTDDSDAQASAPHGSAPVPCGMEGNGPADSGPEGRRTAKARVGVSAVTFRSGFILQFVNPKFYLYTLTLAAVLAPVARTPLDMGVIGVFFGGIVVAGMFAWAFAGALLQHVLRRWHRASSILMALALVWCAVTLF